MAWRGASLLRGLLDLTYPLLYGSVDLLGFRCWLKGLKLVLPRLRTAIVLCPCNVQTTLAPRIHLRMGIQGRVKSSRVHGGDV